MIFNTDKLKNVINEISTLNNIKNLVVDEFKELNVYYKDNFIYFIFIGNYYDTNVVKFIYRFNYETEYELSEGYYTLPIKDFTKSLRYFGESIDITIGLNTVSLKNPIDSNLHITLNLLPNNPSSSEYIHNLFLTGNIQYKINSFGNEIPIINIQEIENQIKYKDIDKTDTNNYISFLNDKMSVQQFNYTTITNLNLGITGRIPSPFLKTFINFNRLETTSLQKVENNIEICSENMYGIIDNIDNDYQSVENFSFDASKGMSLNKKEVLNILSLVKDFSVNSEGYVTISPNKISFSNLSTSSELTEYTIKVSKDIDVMHINNNYLTFGFDISILQGLINLITDDVFVFVVEKNANNNDVYLCYIADNYHKNVMVIEAYN